MSEFRKQGALESLPEFTYTFGTNDPFMLRINLISSPRNVSTAMMYSFAQRTDTQVVDEPFYGYYLKVRPADHPGRDEVIASMETNPVKIVDRLLAFADKPVLFIKNMAHHLIHIEERFFTEVTNLFLIRNPRQLIGSFAQVIAKPRMTDIGVAKQYELYTRVLKSGRNPVVLDSGELLKDPEHVMTELCSRLGLPFERSMLSWTPGPRPEDGIWAKHWYHNVHKSSGFEPQPTSSRPLDENLIPLYERALPYYLEMFEKSLKAG
jgi:hypothetical protein